MPPQDAAWGTSRDTVRGIHLVAMVTWKETIAHTLSTLVTTVRN